MISSTDNIQHVQLTVEKPSSICIIDVEKYIMVQESKKIQIWKYGMQGFLDTNLDGLNGLFLTNNNNIQASSFGRQKRYYYRE